MKKKIFALAAWGKIKNEEKNVISVMHALRII